MSRLIDAEKYRKEFLDSRDFEPMKILDFQPTVKAISLDKVKQAREEIEQLKHKNTDVEGYRWWNNAIDNCLHELDELIESEE
jgi:hypothetical protein